jgi:hypothetical protein
METYGRGGGIAQKVRVKITVQQTMIAPQYPEGGKEL